MAITITLGDWIIIAVLIIMGSFAAIGWYVASLVFKATASGAILTIDTSLGNLEAVNARVIADAELNAQTAAQVRLILDHLGIAPPDPAWETYRDHRR